MPEYNPDEPLIFMHIPKTGGVTVSSVLRTWFNDRYILARDEGYPDLRNDPRIRQGRACIRAHFNVYRKQLEKVYHGATQLFTVIREPFDMVLSLYFYGLRQEGKTRAKEIGSIDKYLDFVLEKPATASLFSWLPRREPGESLTSFANSFILVGTTNRMQETMSTLAAIIGQPQPKIGVRNQTPRPDYVPDRRVEFREVFRDEYALYEMALKAIDSGKPLGWGAGCSSS